MKKASENLKNDWICEICKKPILEENPGYIQIFNIDESLGRFGGYPQKKSYIGFLLSHQSFDINDKKANPYWIEIESKMSPKCWEAQIIHLSRKPWMSEQDICNFYLLKKNRLNESLDKRHINPREYINLG